MSIETNSVKRLYNLYYNNLQDLDNYESFHSNHKNKLRNNKSALRFMDIFQQFTFVIKQKEQYIDLKISNNTNRCDRQKQ